MLKPHINISRRFTVIITIVTMCIVIANAWETRPQFGQERGGVCLASSAMCAGDSTGANQFAPGFQHGPWHKDGGAFSRAGWTQQGKFSPEQAAQIKAKRAEMRAEQFRKADVNGDGKLSVEEFMAMGKDRFERMCDRRFTMLDANGDGLIQLSELQAHQADKGGMARQGMTEEKFHEADLNGDGVLNWDEFVRAFGQFRQKMFDRMDANHDGFLQPEEMQNAPLLRPDGMKTSRNPNSAGELAKGQSIGASAPGMQSGQDVTQYRLDANYPNPFNSSTTISYEIPKASHVTLKVYNVAGQVVKTLVDEDQDASTYQVKLDPADMASGVYLYHLQAGDFSAVNKMMYLK
jgi:Ca2+-binding EF-hand superfamily protein